MRKVDYVQQILTALLAEVPAIASVDDAKTALVDASLRELAACVEGWSGWTGIATAGIGESIGPIQCPRS